MEIERKFGQATTFDFPLLNPTTSEFDPTLSFEDGDVVLIHDSDTTELAASVIEHLGYGIYRITLDGLQMSYNKIVLVIVDQTGPKAWSDQAILIKTYGNTNAQQKLDPDDTLTKNDFLAFKD